MKRTCSCQVQHGIEGTLSVPRSNSTPLHYSRHDHSCPSGRFSAATRQCVKNAKSNAEVVLQKEMEGSPSKALEPACLREAAENWCQDLDNLVLASASCHEELLTLKLARHCHNASFPQIPTV